MPLLDILEAPHPILAKKARDVRPDEFGPALKTLLDNMAETMYAAPGVGLAAPQIGDSRRILVADPGFEGEDGEQKKGIELVFMVNPTIVAHGEGTITWSESCLSVPEYSQNIDRHDQIDVEFQDADGNRQVRRYEGFSAVVIQHEMDHLSGVTLLEHSSRFKRNRYLQKQKKVRRG